MGYSMAGIEFTDPDEFYDQLQGRSDSYTSPESFLSRLDASGIEGSDYRYQSGRQPRGRGGSTEEAGPRGGRRGSGRSHRPDWASLVSPDDVRFRADWSALDGAAGQGELEGIIREYFGDIIDNWEVLVYGLQIWDIDAEDDNQLPADLRDLIVQLEYIVSTVARTEAGIQLIGQVEKVFPGINIILTQYASWKSRQLTTLETILANDRRTFEEKMADLFSRPGEPRFIVATDFITTAQDTVTQIIRDNTRDNVAPRVTLPYELSVGLSKFAVPPLNISLTSDYKVTSITGGALRQPNSPKFNTGHSETYVNVTLYFPNHDSIWGYEGEGDFDIDFDNDSEEKIDYYMSSLRGLVTAFKFSPFLPIKNMFLNSTFGITGVAMQSMTVQSLEGFPFVLAVNLTLTKFNHKPFLPMIRDFNQAIHWGKYRQYCGAAARSLGSRVEKGFLVDSPIKYFDGVEMNGPGHFTADEYMFDESGRAYQYDLDQAPSYQYNNLMSKVKEGTFDDLRHFQLYYPKNITSKVYAPDIAGFRTPYEDFLYSFDQGSTLWDRFVSNVAGIDIVDFVGEGDAPSYKDVVNYSKSSKADEGKMSDVEKIFTFLANLERIQNDTATGELFELYFTELLNELNDKSGSVNQQLDDQAVANLKIDVQRDWLTVLLFQFQEQPYIKEIMNNMPGAKDDRFVKEWEIPMEKMEVNWEDVHINGISLSMGNNIVRHQLQMQEDPVHQHIGGRDTQINVSMIVQGEAALISFRRVMSHINGLARLEHAKGVVGFLGIKNTITALCGVKYVLPLSFEVNTIPGYPHVYQVNMTLVDFDIFQQKREALNSDQQKQFIDMFGKRNPFLRLKQYWGASNNYPDFPLQVTNDEGNVVGFHDPDFYFRSFQTLDDDLVTFEPRPAPTVTDNSALNTYQDILTFDPATSVDTVISAAESINSVPRQDPAVEVVDNDISNVFKIKTNLGSFNENQSLQHMIDINGKTLSIYDYDSETGTVYNSLEQMQLKDDLAEDSLTAVLPGATGYGDYQGSNVYNDPTFNLMGINSDYTADESSQYESMMKDAQYRGSTGGRMLKAFPTYMLWLIDEGGTFAGTRLFDNFYGLNSVIDFSVVQSEDILGDTLVLRVSNMYQKLSREAQTFLSYDSESDSGFASGLDNIRNQITNHWRHMVDDPPLYYQELNNIRLKPGVRLHLRAGYGSNPNSLDTIFNGVVTEVQQGDIVTVIAQSDAIELSAMVNTENEDGHSGKIDGAMSTGFFLSEPRDLMVKLLSMGSSTFKEQIALATRGVIFSESKFGIRHFGNILYEALNEREEIIQERKLQAIADSANIGEIGGVTSNLFGATGQIAALAGAVDTSQLSVAQNVFGQLFTRFGVGELMQVMWVNLYRSRDYEIFKRNIYPGNGTGIMQFAGIDTLDAASILRGVTRYRSQTQALLDGVAPSNTQLNAAYYRALAEADETVLDKGYTIQDFTQNDVLGETRGRALADSLNISVENDETDSGGASLGDYIEFGKKIFDIGFSVLQGPAALPNYLAANTVNAFLPGEPVSTGIIGSIFRAPYTKGRGVNPIAAAMGFTTELDDDLKGYDEISFRAQTYMRTVWDLCKICADMLPNYIVAVRPFEDRSTLFYGKPHWLYTSGLVPLTTGIPKTKTLKIEEPNEQLRLIQEYIARQLSPEADRKLQQSYTFGGGSRSDPYASPVQTTWAGGNIANLPPIHVNSGARLPRLKTKVSSNLEMHLGVHGGEPLENDKHMQDPSLPERFRYPFYMDRIGGAQGGTEDFSVDDQNQVLAGAPGAFGDFLTNTFLDAASEQYYMAARWPYSSLHDEKIEGQTKQMFRHRRIMVFNEDNGRACCVTPGDYGPHKDVDVDIGLSPDATWWLCGKDESKMGRLNNLWIGFVDDTTALGPVRNPSQKLPGSRGTPSFYDQHGVNTLDLGYTNAPPGGVGEPIVVEEQNLTVENLREEADEKFERFLRASIHDSDSERLMWLTSAASQEAGDDNLQFENIEKFKEWAVDFYEGDIDSFAERFGWALWDIDPVVRYNADVARDGDMAFWSYNTSGIGQETYALFNEDADAIYNAIDGSRISLDLAREIWEAFRIHFPTLKQTAEIYLEYDENRLDFQSKVDTGDDIDPSNVYTYTKYRTLVAQFMQFMWVDPYRRAWLVVTSGRKDTVGGTVSSVGDAGQLAAGAIDAAGGVIPGAVGDAWGWLTDKTWKQLADAGEAVFEWVGDQIDRVTDEVVDSTVNPTGAVTGVESPYGAVPDSEFYFDATLEVWKYFCSPSTTYDERTEYSSGLGATGQESRPETAMDSFMEANAFKESKSGSFITSIGEDIANWWNRGIGGVLSEIGNLYSAVITTYRLQMEAMNLNLSQAGQMQIQANIMNRVLNDSIYYDPEITDPLLRLADNPFTREYGEPVIEVREPFQRMHYLSSFNDIISNNIFETTNDVNTVITASSDGKYPVTMYFDKGAPSNMQKEGSVESGLFWDNPRSSGFFSFLHPILNPIETYRGLYKEVTNSTDEMLSKRIAMSHLRQNLQDIYNGELTILGNTSIRPHDLVYLSDIYEQMYGMFEVEEIVHHFTPDMGFVSTVKPNALVTVNDPGRWAFINVMRQKFGVKDIRDTTRNSIDLKSDGIPNLERSSFNLDNIHETIEPIVRGATQFTGGSAAIINDIQSRAYSGYLGYPQQAYDDIRNLETGNEGLGDSLLASLGLISAFTPVGSVGAFVGNSAYNVGLKNSILTFVPFADLIYDAWDWVQENLKDQHSCYISYLNKNGQPMDAGLSYNQGVAVGHWYSKSTLPGLLVNTTRIRNPDGNVRITYDDLLESLGWNEIDISGMVKRTSLYVDQINTQILNLSGFGPDPVTLSRPYVIMARVIRVIDGDTIDFEYVAESIENGILNPDVLELVPPSFNEGQLRLRFSGINTPEMGFYNTQRSFETSYDIPNRNDPSSALGAVAKEYVINALNPNQEGDEDTEDGKIIAIRVDPTNLYDNNDRVLGVIFHTTPEGTSPEDRLQVLYDLASENPLIPWDSYHSDGRPYTLNWELVIKGYASISLAAMNTGLKDYRDNLNGIRGGK